MIHHGDCLDVMAGMESESVDAIVTDPPYGLEFMGKAWDKLVPTAGRADLKRREGFTPHKSEFKQGVGTNIGAPKKNPRCRKCGKLQFDHPKGKCRCESPDWNTRQSEYAFLNQVWHEEWATAAYRVAKPSAYLLAFGGTRTVHRMTVALEDAGWIIRDMLVWAYASGFPKSKASLKPAWEPIVMARKPGPLRMLAIDACRIPSPDADLDAIQRQQVAPSVRFGNIGKPDHEQPIYSPAGRWPANVILTAPIFDGGWDGVVGGGEASGIGGAYDPTPSDASASVFTNHGPGVRRNGYHHGDSGTYSRFFLVPKADRSDREPVLVECSSDALKPWWCMTHNCAWPPLKVCPGRGSRRNSHPTVKPTDLMRHLVRLVTPSGGTVLDPFLGSGTTGLACELEGFPWIGIEREAEYVAIAEARLNGTQRGLGLVS